MRHNTESRRKFFAPLGFIPDIAAFGAAKSGILDSPSPRVAQRVIVWGSHPDAIQGMSLSLLNAGASGRFIVWMLAMRRRRPPPSDRSAELPTVSAARRGLPKGRRPDGWRLSGKGTGLARSPA